MARALHRQRRAQGHRADVSVPPRPVLGGEHAPSAADGRAGGTLARVALRPAVAAQPGVGFDDHPAMWVTERGGRLRPRGIEERFATYRDALGMDSDLTPHCLRHSHVTHLVEDGTDPKFVQEQVGHRFASTTAIYTNVSGDFMNTMLRQHLDRGLQPAEEDNG